MIVELEYVSIPPSMSPVVWHYAIMVLPAPAEFKPKLSDAD